MIIFPEFSMICSSVVYGGPGSWKDVRLACRSKREGMVSIQLHQRDTGGKLLYEART
jgi:hypothetical protein